VLLAAAPVLIGCSFLVDAGDDQCTRDRDCGDLGLSGSCEQGVCVLAAPTSMREDGVSAPDGGLSGDPSSCLGSMRCDDGEICFKDQCVAERDVERFVCEAQTPAMAERVRFAMHVKEFVSDQPPIALTASACMRNDVSCANPVAMFEDSEGTGDIELELPYDFSGFLEVRSEDTLTALWYFTEPLREPRVAKDLKIPSPATVELLAAITGLSVDASRGLVILEAFDCAQMASGGIHFEESKQRAIPFYIIDEQPNVESTVTVRDDDTNEAIGGFLNATPGFTLFTAHIGVDGPRLGEYNANVRANTVTYLDIYP
jgi:hypothetical protein